MRQELWSTDLNIDPAGKETLVIHCSDWRFVEPTHKFLHENLKIRSYDLVVVPGAIHFLASHLYPKYSWVAKRWLKFFFKHHGTKRVIAFSHEDCGWYKTMYALEHWSEKLGLLQEADAKSASAEIADLSEGVAVEYYLIGFSDGRVTVFKTG